MQVNSCNLILELTQSDDFPIFPVVIIISHQCNFKGSSDALFMLPISLRSLLLCSTNITHFIGLITLQSQQNTCQYLPFSSIHKYTRKCLHQDWDEKHQWEIHSVEWIALILLNFESVCVVLWWVFFECLRALNSTSNRSFCCPPNVWKSLPWQANKYQCYFLMLEAPILYSVLLWFTRFLT